MSGIFRSMIADGNMPTVGSASKMLGVRDDGYDIPIEPNGNVRPHTGGLSVSPDWRSLPPFLVPHRLRTMINSARGSNRLACFRLDVLPFQEVQITELLVLRPNTSEHGTIEPSRDMLLSEFQDALAVTRESWIIDER